MDELRLDFDAICGTKQFIVRSLVLHTHNISFLQSGSGIKLPRVRQAATSATSSELTRSGDMEISSGACRMKFPRLKTFPQNSRSLNLKCSMCTVSFIPGADGYCLGMNRDESRLRPIAFQPEVCRTPDGFAVYPSEPGGGTWIGMNDSGLCLALINWYKVPTLPVRRTMSRGIVVKEMIQSRTLEDLSDFLRKLPLEEMPPFRLIAISLRE